MDEFDAQGNPRRIGRSGRFRKTPQERALAKAQRRMAEGEGTTAALINFLIHLGSGAKPLDALKAAHLFNAKGEDEEARAEALVSSTRVRALLQAIRMDPKLILQQHLSALALAEVDLAFNAKNEMVRLKAIQDALSRGGLPVESVQYHGTGKDLQNASKEQLLERVKMIYEALKASAADEPKKIDG